MLYEGTVAVLGGTLARSHGNRTLSPSNLWNDVEASAELTSMVFDLFGACAEGFSYGGNGCIPL